MAWLNMANHDMSFLEKMNLMIEGMGYPLDDYAIGNTFLLLQNLLNGKDNRLIILHPTAKMVAILSSVVIPLTLVKLDVDRASQDITEHLKKGDKVYVDGCLGEVKEITYVQGKKGVVLRFNDLDYFFIPANRIWRIQKYEGNAVNLHNYKAKKKKLIKPKTVLCNILDFEEGEIPLAFNCKTLIVTEKQLFIKEIEKVSLGNTAYTTVFPTGYFKSSTEFERIGTDPFQRLPIICLVSSMAIACDMVESDPTINAVIILEGRKLNGNYIYLERIKNIVKNIVILQEIRKFEEEDIELITNLGFQVFNWSQAKIKDLDIIPDWNADNASHILREQRILLSLANPIHIKLLVHGEVGDIIQKVKFSLDQIRKADFESDYKIPFVARCFDGLLRLRAVPIQINDPIIGKYQFDYFQGLISDLNDLNISMGYTICGEIKESVNTIIEDIKTLICLHHDYHPKYSLFDVTDDFNRNDCIVVPKSRHKEIIDKWFFNQQKHINRCSIITMSEVNSVQKFYDRVLFTGWFGEKHAKIMLSPIGEKHFFLLYPFEQEWMDKNQSWLLNYLLRFEGNIPTKKIDETLIDYDLDKYIRKMVEKQQLFYQGLNLKNNEEDSNYMVDCYFIEFEDDYYAFLTEGYKCRYLDNDEENIVKKKVTELLPGDKLVFIKDSSEDIFEKLVKTVQESSPEIKQQVETSRLWKTALIEYKELNNYSYQTIRLKLEHVGLKRVATTVRLWMNDEGFQLGRYLAQSISSAVSGSGLGNEDGLLKKVTQDLSQYAITVTVTAVSHEKTNIPVSRSNILIEK